ncbi:MAG: aminoglycoside phosphotransferase family protein [Chloroflexi bacterium]|nr:aminoglycoside phosphotransferase family protein [Chloroflexota bacterium]
MNPSEPAPIVFDPLKPPAERILRNYHESAVRIANAELLTRPDRRNRIWRCMLDAAGAQIPGTVIVKQVAPTGYDPDNPDAEDTLRFFGDWAGAHFLSQVCKELHGPRFFGGDVRAGFIVLEDLGEHRSLVQPLLEGDQATATRALLAFVRRLGRMHASALGHEEEFDAILRAINPAAPSPGNVRRDQHIDTAIDQIHGLLAEVGVELTEAARREMRAMCDTVYGPGPFRTFIHTDPCPDNVFYDGDTLRLIDFEASRFGHALHDGLYCRVPFPSCWCANRVPPDVVAQAEQAYRGELAAACPAALDDRLFYAAAVDVLAFWTCECLLWLQRTLKEDNRWGIAGVRSRILTRLATFIEAAGTYERLPALQTACEQALASLARRWPEVQPLPVYPAFRASLEEVP